MKNWYSKVQNVLWEQTFFVSLILCVRNEKWKTGFKISAWVDEGQCLPRPQLGKKQSSQPLQCFLKASFHSAAILVSIQRAHSTGPWCSRALCIIYSKSLNKTKTTRLCYLFQIVTELCMSMCQSHDPRVIQSFPCVCLLLVNETTNIGWKKSFSLNILERTSKVSLFG